MGYYIETGKSTGKIQWLIDNHNAIDDIVTTETSFNQATKFLDRFNIKVGEYLVVLDRRAPEHKTLEIRSLCTIQDLNI